MGGAMPEVCGRCRAFQVSGRPDCPFCGAEAAAAALPVVDERSSAGAPSWSPPDGSLPTPSPPLPKPPHRSVGTAGKVLGAVAVVAAIGALFAFLPDPGSKPRPRAEAVKPEPPTPIEELEGVCAGKPVPIQRAKAYDGQPGPHRVELLEIVPVGRWPELDNGRIALPDGWNQHEGDDVPLDQIELVGCFIVAHARLERTCDYQGGFTQELWVRSGRLVVREARTGKELLRQEVPEVPEECGNLAVTGDDIVYGSGFHRQVIDALRPFSGGP